MIKRLSYDLECSWRRFGGVSPSRKLLRVLPDTCCTLSPFDVTESLEICVCAGNKLPVRILLRKPTTALPICLYELSEWPCVLLKMTFRPLQWGCERKVSVGMPISRRKKQLFLLLERFFEQHFPSAGVSPGS